MLFEEFQDGTSPGGHLGYRNLKDFSNFGSLCHCDASHQVSAQSDKMLFEEFPDGHCGGHLGYHNETILAILNLCSL